jgi:hypothetical protein
MLRPTLLLRASNGDLLFGDAGSDGARCSFGAGFCARMALYGSVPEHPNHRSRPHALSETLRQKPAQQQTSR